MVLPRLGLELVLNLCFICTRFHFNIFLATQGCQAGERDCGILTIHPTLCLGTELGFGIGLGLGARAGTISWLQGSVGGGGAGTKWMMSQGPIRGLEDGAALSTLELLAPLGMLGRHFSAHIIFHLSYHTSSDGSHVCCV